MNVFDRRTVCFGIGAALSSAAASPAEAAIETREVGAVSTMRGMVFAERGADSVSLFVRSPVLLNDMVRTGAESRCGLNLGSSTTVQLGANAKLRIQRYVIDIGGELRLDSGAILIDKNDQARNQKLNLNTEFALIAIRGTAYFAGPIDGGFGVFCGRGRVQVTAAGRSVILARTEGTMIARVGAPPEAPRRWAQEKIQAALALVR